jgi:hypothetical protein
MARLKYFTGVFLVSLLMVFILATYAFADDENIITVTTSDELMQISADSQTGTTYEGKTIKITNDIEITGTWTPLINFKGSIDGDKGNNESAVITGLSVSTSENAGLIGNASGGVVKNLTISGASIESTGNSAGTFAGDGFTTSFENCVAINSTVTGKRFVGGIVGTGYGNVTDCHVIGTAESLFKVQAYKPTTDMWNNAGDNIGGIIGYVGEGNTVISDCTVNYARINGARQIGGIAGLENYGNTIKSCTVSNSQITQSGTLAAGIFLGNRTPAIGGIVGQYNASDETCKIYTVNNTVENTTITQTYSKRGLYAGAIVGDATYGKSATCYELSGNTCKNNVQVVLGSALQDPTPEIGNK